MNLFRESWFYYLTGFIAGLALFVLAITGSIHSGRYGQSFISVKSVPLRVAFFFISVGIFSVLIWMVKQHLAGAIQKFGQSS